MSMMPEQCQQNNDWQRDAQQPKQCASTKAHNDLLLFLVVNVDGGAEFLYLD